MSFKTFFRYYLAERYPEVSLNTAEGKYEDLTRSGIIKILERSYGFATYILVGDALILCDMYILPEHRNKGLSATLANELDQIAQKANKRVIITFSEHEGKGQEMGTRAMNAYGFKKAQKARTRDIYMKGLN